MNRNLLVLFLFKLVCAVSSYRILIVFPTPVPSHYILGNSLAKGLANAGHDVTILSRFEEKNPPKNGKYKSIVLTGASTRIIDPNVLTVKEIAEMHLIKKEYLFNGPGNVFVNFTMNHPNFQQLINSDEKFDVIILEQFLIDALKILACHFNAPLIAISTFGPSFWVNPAAGNPSPPSYVPDSFIGYTSKMTFWQRVKNSLFTLTRYIIRDLFYIPEQVQYAKDYFPHCPEADNVYYNVSLTLTNYHESINYPVPLVPSIIPIGGYHIEPPKKLPNELQEYLDNAVEGVIYFSLGSNVLSDMMENHIKEAIIHSLGKRKEKVLWKWEEEEFPGKPVNIKTQKWLPQQSILAHPNLKLFISHGGILSIMETVYHGVPILTLPIFADQYMNGAMVEDQGYGLNLPYIEITEEGLTERLNKLLNDTKYRENAKKRSVLMHDRPIKPMDLAIYWTEFVARHKGAPHLRVAGLDLAWYQYLLLDVIGAVCIVILSVIIIVYQLCKKMCTSSIGEASVIKLLSAGPVMNRKRKVKLCPHDGETTDTFCFI